MSKVTSDMTLSPDGFIAGPNDDKKNGLGIGGEISDRKVKKEKQWLTLTDSCCR